MLYVSVSLHMSGSAMSECERLHLATKAGATPENNATDTPQLNTGEQ